MVAAHVPKISKLLGFQDTALAPTVTAPTTTRFNFPGDSVQAFGTGVDGVVVRGLTSR